MLRLILGLFRRNVSLLEDRRRHGCYTFELQVLLKRVLGVKGKKILKEH